ncbi:MAG: hypothetical protein HC837_01500 [Chloroflexaceae bacterium]|nr:hypothetical protein [Chloroflexaceae bacterium]
MNVVGYDIGGLPYCPGCAPAWYTKQHAVYPTLISDYPDLPTALSPDDLWDTTMRCIECDSLLVTWEVLQLDDHWKQEQARQNGTA